MMMMMMICALHASICTRIIASISQMCYLDDGDTIWTTEPNAHITFMHAAPTYMHAYGTTSVSNFFLYYAVWTSRPLAYHSRRRLRPLIGVAANIH